METVAKLGKNLKKKTKPLKKRKTSLKKKQMLRFALVRLGYVIQLCYKDIRIAYFEK